MKVIIGGIGGSGTRLIANLISSMGIHIGSHLNVALDNLDFTYLFVRNQNSKIDFDLRFSIFQKLLSTPHELSGFDFEVIEQIQSSYLEENTKGIQWINKCYDSIIDRNVNLEPSIFHGFKEPNSHIFIDQIININPEVKYVHVIRHGLDMAFSENQSQLERWGKRFIDNEITRTPENALKYWCGVNRKIKERVGRNVAILNYDKLCREPHDTLMTLLSFLELEISNTTKTELLALIETPKSMGRYKNYPNAVFDHSDIECVRGFGFNIDK